jgi:hypothetical protein
VVDVIVLGRRLQEVEVFTLLVKHTNKMELEMNEKKDKIDDSVTESLQ